MLHQTNNDITITAAYALGSQYTHTQVQTQPLDHNASHYIIGIGANPYVGRDTQPPVESYRGSQWTRTGQELAEIAQTKQLSITLIVQHLKYASLTLQNRDGRARTRADYISVDTAHMGNVIQHTGATNLLELTAQRTAADQHPVILHMSPLTFGEPTRRNN